MVLDFKQMVEIDLQDDLPVYLLSCYGMYSKDLHGTNIGGDAFMLPGEHASVSTGRVFCTAWHQEATLGQGTCCLHDMRANMLVLGPL
jgi:hypothetical protein